MSSAKLFQHYYKRAQYDIAKEKLSNSQLNLLKSAAKNASDLTLRLS